MSVAPAPPPPATDPAEGARGVADGQGAGAPATPPPDRCPLCGTPLAAEQEWCLRCGAAARTRLATSSNWKAPIVAIATVAVLSLGVLAASLAALAGDFGSSTTPAATTVVAAAPTTAAPTSAPSGAGTTASAANPGTASGPLSKEPTVTPPTGPPPSKVVIKEIITGTGQTANVGDTVTVNYVGVLYNGGAQFDSSWRRGKRFTFTLNTNQVIAGWNQGVTGMRVGGRRELIVPAAEAYGAQGLETRPVAIPPNAALVFVVDLLEVSSPSTTSRPAASAPAHTTPAKSTSPTRPAHTLSGSEITYIHSIEKLEKSTRGPAQKKRYRELLEALRKGK